MEIEFTAKLFDLSVCLASPRRIAAPEFSRGFQPTVGVSFIPRRVSDD
jgi:hypothetical protein